MFSTDYFMYSEDIDLSLKVRKTGLKRITFRPGVVVHHGGGSTAQGCANTFSECREDVGVDGASFKNEIGLGIRDPTVLRCSLRALSGWGWCYSFWPIGRLRRKGSLANCADKMDGQITLDTLAEKAGSKITDANHKPGSVHRYV